MAKKKNTQKKHKFKHVEATEPAVVAAQAAHEPAVSAGETKQPLRAAAVTATTGGRDHRYVGPDLRRIGISAVVLVALELVLYYVLTMTSAGEAIYNLVQV
jgi:hypothetical protein